MSGTGLSQRDHQQPPPHPPPPQLLPPPQPLWPPPQPEWLPWPPSLELESAPVAQMAAPPAPATDPNLPRRAAPRPRSRRRLTVAKIAKSARSNAMTTTGIIHHMISSSRVDYVVTGRSGPHAATLPIPTPLSHPPAPQREIVSATPIFSTRVMTGGWWRSSGRRSGRSRPRRSRRSESSSWKDREDSDPGPTGGGRR